MRIFLSILILIFSLQSFSNASDISDFEIDGMSIGDSALDHLSLAEINTNKSYLYNTKKYASSHKKSLEWPYEFIQFDFIDNDEKFIIKALTGMIYYENKDFNKCYVTEKIIVSELKNLFKSKVSYQDFGNSPHPADTTGLSTGTWHVFTFNDNSGYIFVECMDWTEKMDFKDALKVSILSKEANDYLDTEGYN